MSDRAFKLEIITPAGLAREDATDEVTLAAKNGEIGILPQHAKYTGLLGTGLLTYFSTESNQTENVVIGGGFCNFHNDTLTILADSIDTLDSVDKDSYADEREKFAEILDTADTYTPEFEEAQIKLARIEAIDRLLSH